MNDSKSVSEKFIAPHIAALPPSGIRKFFDLVNAMDDVISLGVGEPDFTTPWTIRESGIYSLERGHTGYTSNLGTPALRRAICDYLMDAITDIACNLPEHTVIPYRNIAKKYYPSNLEKE